MDNTSTFSKRILLGSLFAILLFSTRAQAAVYHALANGPWSAASTWSINRAPTDNDTIVVGSGITVTVDINSPTYANMKIIVQGTLSFEQGQKINMCPGRMLVTSGGMLTGGTPGSKVNICGNTVWIGPDESDGPINFNSSSPPITVMTYATEAKTNGSGVARIGITWSTPYEEASSSFEIERSTNGLTFETIGTVAGQGESASKQEYTYEDENPAEGINYYRIKLLREGKEPVEADKTLAANNTEAPGGCVLAVYPNPCEGECQVRFSDCPSDNTGSIVVQMVDANGNTVSTTVPERDANGAFSMKIDASNNLAPGMYIVRGTSQKKSYTQKAVLK